MMENNLTFISKYGFKPLGYSAAAFVVFLILDIDFFTTLAFFSMVVLLFVYRNPEREMLHYDEQSITAPCDGVVKSIEELENDGQYRYKIEIDSSMFDVAILRMPLFATVQSLHVTRGTRLSAKSKLFDILNESLEILLKDKAGRSVKMVQRLKQSFLPLSFDHIEGLTLPKGSRYGYANNHLTTIYLEKNVRINVKVGEKVDAAKTLLAYFS